MNSSREKLKRIGSCFDRLHTTLGCLREHLEDVGDDKVMALMQDMEFGTLAPMRKLRQYLDIPYNWQEQQEAGNGRGD